MLLFICNSIHCKLLILCLNKCGDYYKINEDTPGYIYNPGYPNAALSYLKCIWLIEAPKYYYITFNVTFQGERFSDICSDYIEIRDGSRYSPVIKRFCDTHINEHVRSKAHLLWVKLVTDGVNNTNTKFVGFFQAIDTGITSGHDNTSSIHTDCRSYEFECRNKECLSMSYRCDGYNDCGCTVDCDESGCEELDLTKDMQLCIGVSVGVLVFLFVCGITCLIENQSNWIASRVEELRLRENQAEERRKKAYKAFTKFIGEKEVL
ncbi:bone morphogenetic protein 1-like isoform X2 [Physella acuta]|uniref:bone morphogenetic protein 1-like isoform X2 n=1 Tax=Physella acuta TaxID=109671 RepID=UPI0027DACFCD|nr:bone morphogenetic protein 1-like isoform X2 [Physella acuta]